MECARYIFPVENNEMMECIEHQSSFTDNIRTIIIEITASPTVRNKNPFLSGLNSSLIERANCDYDHVTLVSR